MSLPRKRKRLSENQIPDENRQPGRAARKSAESPSLKVTARTRQMQKAFEIVDHIEHVHGDIKRSEPAVSVPSPDPRVPSDPEGFRMRVSLGSTPMEAQATGACPEGTPSPVIEVKLTIPSFFWKVPVLGGMARNLIRRFTKQQA